MANSRFQFPITLFTFAHMLIGIYSEDDAYLFSGLGTKQGKLTEVNFLGNLRSGSKLQPNGGTFQYKSFPQLGSKSHGRYLSCSCKRTGRWFFLSGIKVTKY